MNFVFIRKSSLRNFLGRLRRNENAQSTFEYILMLSIAVALAILVIKTLIVPVLNYLSSAIGDVLHRTLFNKQTMHKIRLK